MLPSDIEKYIEERVKALVKQSEVLRALWDSTNNGTFTYSFEALGYLADKLEIPISELKICEFDMAMCERALEIINAA